MSDDDEVLNVGDLIGLCRSLTYATGLVVAGVAEIQDEGVPVPALLLEGAEELLSLMGAALELVALNQSDLVI